MRVAMSGTARTRPVSLLVFYSVRTSIGAGLGLEAGDAFRTDTDTRACQLSARSLAVCE